MKMKRKLMSIAHTSISIIYLKYISFVWSETSIDWLNCWLCRNPNLTEEYSRLIYSQQSQSPFSWLADGSAAANTITMSLQRISGSEISVSELPAAGELELWLDTHLGQSAAEMADLESRIIAGHTVFPDAAELLIHQVKVESGATLLLNIMHNVLFAVQNISAFENGTATPQRVRVSDGSYIGT